MGNVYACPVHVDQKSTEAQRVCPICGIRPIVLRAGKPEEEGAQDLRRGTDAAPAVASVEPSQAGKEAAPAAAPPAAPAAPAIGAVDDLARDLDQAIALLSRIRVRLPVST